MNWNQSLVSYFFGFTGWDISNMFTRWDISKMFTGWDISKMFTGWDISKMFTENHKKVEKEDSRFDLWLWI